MRCFRTSWITVGVFLPSLAFAADESTPGEVSSPYPTLENLSIEWALEGDDNLNATVAVAYRRAGETEFRDGLSLFRVPAGSNQGFDWSNKFAGSIFGLSPGTTYEIQLSLTDADGGDTNATLEATTRVAPTVPEDASEVVVTPDTLDAALNEAGPGTVLTLEEGTYGEIVVENDGAPGQPLVLRSAAGAVATVEGDVRIDGRSHVLVDGLWVHGKFKFNDAAFIGVQNCTIEAIDDGIVAYGNGVDNAVITNNVIIGPTIWRESALGVDGDNLGEGVVLTGAGNVVSFNRVSGFRDCLSLLEDDEAQNQVSNDFYGNDLTQCADDAIEADFAMGNVRVYQNRISDSFMGLSSQPSLGGPTYFVRNVMYNVLFQAFKLQRSSVGDVGLHNTVIKSGDAFSVNTEDVFSYAWFRNNLFIGGPGSEYGGYDQGPGDVMQLPSADGSCSFDYDGYGSIDSGGFEGRVGETRFSSLEELQSSTTEVHAVEVDLGVFADTVSFPADPWDVPSAPAFDLAESAVARDRGVPLANINDGFEGPAPDLGALEFGALAPVYGPDGVLGSIPEAPINGGGAGGEAPSGQAGAASSAGQGSGGTNAVSDDDSASDDDATQSDDDATQSDDDATQSDDDATQSDDDATQSDDDATQSDDDATQSDDDRAGSEEAPSSGNGPNARDSDAGPSLASPSGSGDEGGCGCRVQRTESSHPFALLLGLVAAFWARRRRIAQR